MIFCLFESLWFEDVLRAMALPSKHHNNRKVCLGEMASFYIPSRLAYGAEGSLEERIPPNADLVYKVEILDIESELELALWLIEWKKAGVPVPWQSKAK